MVDSYECERLSQTLQKIGFLGSWHIDYTMDRVQADGRVGAVFGVTALQIKHGVALHELDAAYYPEDLEKMKSVRRSMIGTGGQTRLRYKLRYGADANSSTVECSAFVTLDREGRLKEACGTLMDVAAFEAVGNEPASTAEIDILAGHLLEAAQIARRLNLADIERRIRPALVRVGRIIAKTMPNLRHLQ